MASFQKTPGPWICSSDNQSLQADRWLRKAEFDWPLVYSGRGSYLRHIVTDRNVGSKILSFYDAKQDECKEQG